jgi:hypothetical protein
MLLSLRHPGLTFGEAACEWLLAHSIEAAKRPESSEPRGFWPLEENLKRAYD